MHTERVYRRADAHKQTNTRVSTYRACIWTVEPTDSRIGAITEAPSRLRFIKNKHYVVGSKRFDSFYLTVLVLQVLIMN